jgi:radical SAM superfamily enzyme YgiQ (UPF0313 family)
MKVLFIYTDINSAVGYSAGIGILSAQLKKRGHQTKLIHVSEELDYSLDTARINRDINEFQPGIICFSITTNQMHFVSKIGPAIKEQFDIPIIVGGHHPTADPENVIAEPWVDMLCRGEGDIALCTLADNIDKGVSIDNIPNLFIKAKDNITRNPLITWIQDMDSLPYDDYELFDYTKIVSNRRGWAEVIVTRGCPYPCSYCFNLALLKEYKKYSATANLDFNAKHYTLRRRSVDSSINLLKTLKTKYPMITGFTFVDDVMARDGEWFEEFSTRYHNEINLPYACTSQPLLFNENVAKLLKQSGCKVVKMGIESGNEQIRKLLLRRNITNEHLIDVFGIATKYGLKPQAFNMIGLPGETLDNIMETITLNAQIKPYIVWLSTFNPYPGTDLYFHCKDNNLIVESEWLKNDTYRGSSVLKTECFTPLDFIKVRVLFRWLLNKNLKNEAEKIYEDNISELSALPEKEWLDGTAETLFKQRDQEIDTQLRKQDISHYISVKYINLFWGKEYGYDLS